MIPLPWTWKYPSGPILNPSRIWFKKNIAWDALKVRAKGRVKGAIKRGDLVDWRYLFCADCGGKPYGYEHRDYSKPLDVVPICRKCNIKRGPAIQAYQDWKTWDSLCRAYKNDRTRSATMTSAKGA